MNLLLSVGDVFHLAVGGVGGPSGIDNSHVRVDRPLQLSRVALKVKVFNA